MRKETEAAIRAARAAQQLADSRVGADEVMSKGGIDLVTAADVACEDSIREELLKAFPNYPVIGEERGGDDHSHAIWIDGGPRSADVAREALLSKRWYVWMYSTTVSLAHLADGRISGILHPGPSRVPRVGSVHFAAGCLVASEAGAIVMDIETGKPWDLLTRSYLIAATPEVQEELMRLLKVSLVSRQNAAE